MMSKWSKTGRIFFSLIFFLQSTFCIFPSNDEPRVLILRRIRSWGVVDWGGVATHVLTLYNSLLRVGTKAFILVPENSSSEQFLKAQNLPFFSFKDGDSFTSDSIKNFGDSEAMYRVALDICKNYAINIIHINRAEELEIARKLCSALNKTQKIDIIYQHHDFKNPQIDDLVGVSAFISVNKISAQFVKKQKLGIKSIKRLPPLTQLNQNKNMDITLTREVFFEKNFNIKIHSNVPVLCCVANYSKCKNHASLFEAINKLIYDYKIPVQLMLAGKGNVKMTDYLKQLVKKLKIQDYVYFLGFVNNIQEFLFHSDIKVLVSKQESFALAAIEAALMKKPMVISKNAGVAGTFIFHKKTGMLCDPSSVNDIAIQIKYLIENPLIARRLGEAAYELTSEAYLANGLILEYVKIYTDVLKNRAD